MKTVKISDMTHRKLLKLCGEIQATTEEKTSMEKTILELLNEWERGKGKNHENKA